MYLHINNITQYIDRRSVFKIGKRTLRKNLTNVRDILLRI